MYNSSRQDVIGLFKIVCLNESLNLMLSKTDQIEYQET